MIDLQRAAASGEHGRAMLAWAIKRPMQLAFSELTISLSVYEVWLSYRYGCKGYLGVLASAMMDAAFSITAWQDWRFS